MTNHHRSSLYRQFAAHFRPAARGCRVVPVTAAEIDAAEASLGCTLPVSYRDLVIQVGAGENDEPNDLMLNVREIWQPALIVRQVGQPWLAPIPASLTGGQPIASDVAWTHLTPFASEQSHGHWFCFPRSVQRPDDAPVFFFDHDGGGIERVADGFVDMIERLLRAGPIGDR
jgi:hypothetical protein